MFPITPQMVIYAVIATIVGGYIWHCEAQKKELSKIAILANIAKENAEKKDKENANKLHTALTDRSTAIAALNKLRDNARRRDLSSSAAAPAGSSQVCYAAPAYDAAVERYRGRLAASVGRIAGLATEGDAVAIDAGALIRAWPSP